MAIEGVSGTGLEAQSSQTDAVKSLIRWESPHPLSIAGVCYDERCTPTLPAALAAARHGSPVGAGAATSAVFMIGYLGPLLGEDENWAFDLSINMFPEDGCL